MNTVKQSISMSRPVDVVVDGTNHFISMEEALSLNEQLVSVMLAIHKRQ